MHTSIKRQLYFLSCQPAPFYHISYPESKGSFTLRWQWQWKGLKNSIFSAAIATVVWTSSLDSVIPIFSIAIAWIAIMNGYWTHSNRQWQWHKKNAVAVAVSTNLNATCFQCAFWNFKTLINLNHVSRGFHKYTTLAIMPILASDALLCKNKKIQWKMLPQVGIEPAPLITYDSRSDTILSTLTCHVLFGRSLNFCSCTTWFLDLDDPVRINRAWLYKEPKV